MYFVLQVRENVGKAFRGRRGWQQSGAHDQRPVDGLRGDRRRQPDGAGILPGPGDARATLTRRPPNAGRLDAVVPGGARDGGRGHGRSGRRGHAVAVRPGRAVGARGHRLLAPPLRRSRTARPAVPRSRPVVSGTAAQSRRSRGWWVWKWRRVRQSRRL